MGLHGLRGSSTQRIAQHALAPQVHFAQTRLTPTIEEAAALVPQELLDLSGKVFCSGREAFEAPAPLYILGLNPGGKPKPTIKDSVRGHNEWTLTQTPPNWSAYRDESWGGRPPGTKRMQPRIQHMLRQLELDPGKVPASNVIFLRSRSRTDLGMDFGRLADLCWPFHDHVIRTQAPKAVLCLGLKAGDYIRERLDAHTPLAIFVENNNRRWASHLFGSAAGPKVIVASHPSIAAWNNPAADPTGLVVQALGD